MSAKRSPEAGFVLTLATDQRGLEKLFTPIMGGSILAGIITYTVRLQRFRRTAPVLAATPALERLENLGQRIISRRPLSRFIQIDRLIGVFTGAGTETTPVFNLPRARSGS
jgi:hypothetical protein